MTEDLRALLRDDLNAERPPPLGDVVGAALRDGKRIRRGRRRLAVGGGAAAVVGVLAGVVVVGGALTSPAAAPGELGGVAAAPVPDVGVVPGRRVTPTVTAPMQGGAAKVTAPGFPPPSVPISPTVAASPGHTRTLAIPSGTLRPAEKQKEATPAAMAYLLTQLLPSAQTSSYAVVPGGELGVRVFIDDKLGPGNVQLTVARGDAGTPRPARGEMAKVTIVTYAVECGRAMSVTAEWPDGTTVRIDVDSCPPPGGSRGLPALVADPEAAARIAADPRWGVTMDASLVDIGGQRYPRLPGLAG
ncbi:hypothetical protein [Paractinoplanes atraurantiacus]|uniref:Uncharacterized protein n=1 Tax=Paractinoplanes atraurantiacus TaxID=1036182 RepID=A0A285I9Z8_9ACTN|nr:hypothetical protein [Actinoplanes atraurantiacus]SNY44770.1 hypothetical protein SAMN05421748_107120 [Actinoplanes atraurantiacus]